METTRKPYPVLKQIKPSLPEKDLGTTKTKSQLVNDYAMFGFTLGAFIVASVLVGVFELVSKLI